MNEILSSALEIVAKTDPGMVREHNEDAVFADSSLGLVILADGMGGYNAGEVASGMAVTMLSHELEKTFSEKPCDGMDKSTGQPDMRQCMVDNIAKTNAAIFHAAESQPQYAGMGTTLVTALFHDNRAFVAHAGDSRMYRLRGEEFMKITKDHSLLQDQIDKGMISEKDARHSFNKNLVTRALGVDPQVETEINEFDVLPGDIYLLCSDGLNDMIDDEEIGSVVRMLSVNLDLAATQLIQMANDFGGRDNVSVILVKIRREFSTKQNWQSKIMTWFE